MLLQILNFFTEHLGYFALVILNPGMGLLSEGMGKGARLGGTRLGMGTGVEGGVFSRSEGGEPPGELH